MEERKPANGRIRVVVENVRPEVDGGKFPTKRVCGETVSVEADVFTDGHDSVSCIVLHRQRGAEAWSETPMRSMGNDRWRADFQVTQLGSYEYTVEGWVDHFLTWRKDLGKRIDANQAAPIHLLMGAELVAAAVERASDSDAVTLRDWVSRLRDLSADQAIGLDTELAALMKRYADRRNGLRYDKELTVTVERVRARTGAWYELFPRSCGPSAEQHGTFADCEARLPYVAKMGFDILYLPPIHPIGYTNRKGKNNTETAAPGDTGSPWAIGNEHGGHTAIEPSLGTMEDFERLVAAARRHNLEIALDLAYQCTPDHPWVRDHPQWFRKRPDGTIQFAENPPKKYQDIYPIDFETEDWRALWEELRGVVLFWAGKGIRIFRVDNPHTKAFPFWEWMITTVREQYPDVIFLSEAFTRPKVMHRLAKVGFSQSYTYFTWRNTKEELTTYLQELTASETREYFRPNLWPNTPDILPEYLQVGGRPGFMIRLGLAATVGASYGIYGPAFELCEHEPRSPGSEEYLDSEKYQIRHRDLDSPWSLRDYIARINAIRRENPALAETWNLRFHQISNPMMLCYSKATTDFSNVIVVIVNLDYRYTQAGWTDLDLELLGVTERSFQVHDLIGGGRHLWNGSSNYVELNPTQQPLHIFRLRRKVRTEQDFDYFL